MKQQAIAQRPVAQINVRIDRELKDEGDAVLAEAGLSPSQLVRDLWGKIAQRGTSLDEVLEAFGTAALPDSERAAIDAKLAVLDRIARRRDALASSLSLSSGAMPLYPDGFDWSDRVQAERDRRRGRRGLR